MEILDCLIDKNRKHYKCYDELKKILSENDQIKSIIVHGYANGKISGFTEEMWESIQKQNIRRIDNFEDVFRDGANIGYCTVASKQLSYSLDCPYICGGTLSLLEGTKNCKDGSHTWICNQKKIIDTTLMLIIDETYASYLGYVEENRYNPNLDPIYRAAKEFTLDPSIKNRRTK